MNKATSVFISALKKDNFDEFRDLVYSEVMKIHVTSSIQ